MNKMTQLHPALQQDFLDSLFDEHVYPFFETSASFAPHAFHISKIHLLKVFEQPHHFCRKTIEFFLARKGSNSEHVPHKSIHIPKHRSN